MHWFLMGVQDVSDVGVQKDLHCNPVFKCVQGAMYTVPEFFLFLRVSVLFGSNVQKDFGGSNLPGLLHAFQPASLFNDLQPSVLFPDFRFLFRFTMNLRYWLLERCCRPLELCASSGWPTGHLPECCLLGMTIWLACLNFVPPWDGL